MPLVLLKDSLVFKELFTFQFCESKAKKPIKEKLNYSKPIII